MGRPAAIPMLSVVPRRLAPPNRSRPGAGAVSAAALVLAGSVLALSCRDIIAGDSRDVASELCGLVEACYGADRVYGGCSAFSARLDAAGAEVRQEFLKGIELDGCLVSCPAALGCLDARPFCADVPCAGPSCCAEDVACCGWTDGDAVCSVGACCRPAGVACAGDAECCDSLCVEGSCGGRPCNAVGAACTEGPECCSGLCREAVCVPKDCALIDESCADVTECCAASEQGYDPEVYAKCEGGVCSPVILQCESEHGQLCDPNTPDFCCPGLTCSKQGPSTYVCRETGCVDLNLECEGKTCCGDSICNPFTVPRRCTPPAGCFEEGSTCEIDIECCTGFCLKTQLGSPTGVCAACNTTTCDHEFCETGTPLAPWTCPEGATACLTAVAAVDLYCLCAGWDAICVGYLPELCQLSCPSVGP